MRTELANRMIARDTNALASSIVILGSAEQRVCRWLANARDQTGRDDLKLTQEFLGRMLGLTP